MKTYSQSAGEAYIQRGITLQDYDEKELNKSIMSFHITELEFSEHAKLKLRNELFLRWMCQQSLRRLQRFISTLKRDISSPSGERAASKPDHYLIVVYDEDEHIAGIELWQARKNLLPELVSYVEHATKAAVDVKT